MTKRSKEPKVKIGDRFGKLVVVKETRIPIIARGDGKIQDKQTGKTRKGWICKCDCGRNTKIAEVTLLKPRSSLRSCDKCPPVEDLNHIPEKMTFEEKQEWEELYEYVRTNVMGYDKTQSLPEFIVTRLQGLLRGKYMANNKSKNNANYSYKTVLNTFKFCSNDIRRSLTHNSFKDDQHKFNYIAKIIENNINNVYMRMKNVEKSKEKAEAMTFDIIGHVGADYQRKTEDMTNSLLEDLW